MSRILLKNAQVVSEDGQLFHGYILIENKKILSVGTMDQCPDVPINQTIDLHPDFIISPGFIDIHIHGAAGADVMDGTAKALSTIAQALPSEGTTSFLATTITQEVQQIESALKTTAEFFSSPGESEMIGIHLEGPFINKSKAGAQPDAHILKPNIPLLSRWRKISGNKIKMITYAPENDLDLSFIKYIAHHQMIAAIGHSDGSYKEIERAANNGASHITHLFNGMRGMHHREAGAAGAALLLDSLTNEIIADGYHICPEMVSLALKMKGLERIILITDSMRAKYLQDGHYELGGQKVFVADGMAKMVDGTLAGSILKMNEAVRNMMDFSGLNVVEAIQLASANPAKKLGLFHRKGSIAPGKDSDLVVLDPTMNVVLTICRGEISYERT